MDALAIREFDKRGKDQIPTMLVCQSYAKNMDDFLNPVRSAVEKLQKHYDAENTQGKETVKKGKVSAKAKPKSTAK